MHGWSSISTATVEPVQGIQFYGKYASVIRLPSLFESTAGWSASVRSNFNAGPERSNLWEGGANLLRDDLFLEGDKLRVKASYFDNVVDDYLTRAYIPGGLTLFHVDNIDKAKFRGLELSASYDVGRLFTNVAWTHYLSINFCEKPNQVATSLSRRCYEGGTTNGFAVNQSFTIDAAIDNVTDVYYLDPLALGLMPAPGRTVRLGLTAKF